MRGMYQQDSAGIKQLSSVTRANAIRQLQVTLTFECISYGRYYCTGNIYFVSLGGLVAAVLLKAEYYETGRYLV